MKKYLMIASAALVALASCNKVTETPSSLEKNENAVLTFVSQRPQLEVDTKTAWDEESSSIVWTETDKIRVGYTLNGAWMGQETAGTAKFYASTAVTINEGNPCLGTFEVPISGAGVTAFTDPETSGTYQFYAIYPSTILSNTTVADPTAQSITVKETQDPVNGSFDSSADVLLGKSEEMNITGLPTDPIDLTWTRVVAHAALTFSNMAFSGTEVPSKVTLTFNEDAKVTGAASVNIVDGTIGAGNSNVLVLQNGFTVSGSNISVWGCVLPVTFTSLDVEIKTDKATYTRSITGVSKTFKKNARNTLTVNMATAERVASEQFDWVKKDLSAITASDVFVIVGNNGSDYAMSNNNGTSNPPSAVAVTVANDKLAIAPADNLKWNLSKDGGNYTFYPDGTTAKWLYVYNNNNGLRVGIGDDKVFIIKDSYIYNSGQSRYIGVYNSSDWRSYTSINNNIKDQTFAFYVKTASGPATPSISVTSPLNIPADEDSHTITITRTNFTGAVSVSVPSACTWLSADESFDDDDFEILVDENTGDERSVVLTLSGDGIADVTLEVIQAGISAGTESNPYTASGAVTAANALGESESVENVYVQGYISSITSAYSATHGNISFNISDDGLTTGAQLNIFRIEAASDTDFMVGDFVKIKGTLLNYNGNKPEIDQGGTLISQVKAPRFSPVGGTFTSAQTVTLAADSGATIYYTIDGSDPTTSSSTYSSALNISETTTVKAFAVKGGISSKVVTMLYTINTNVNDGTLAHPYTASEARTLALSGDEGSYYISGIVTKVQNQYSAAYGTANFWIDENGTSESVFEAYKIKYFDNQAWVEGNAQIAINDEVIIYGTLTVYNTTTPETSSGYLVSLNGKTKGLTPCSLSVTTNNANKQITVTWGAASGTDSAISYVVTCGTQSYNANAAGSHIFTMSDYGLYTITVEASSSDAVSSTATTNATLSNPASTTKDYYKLVTSVSDITAGTYVVGALRSNSATNNFYFGKASVSSGDWVVSDNYVTVAESDGVRRFEIAYLPSGAVEFTLTGNNTSGFTISNGSNYLYYTAASNRKLAFAAAGSSYKWTVVAEENALIAGGIHLSHVGTQAYTISENSTGTGAIRGYANTTSYRAIYLFKKVNE